MEKIFNTLIDSYIADKIGIANDFLSLSLATHLKENLQNLHANHQLQSAGTGSQATIDPKKLLRSDVIHWLDRKHDNIYEHEFLNLIDLFVAHLNATCYTSIKSYEFHYTLYEKGSFYKKHIDQFRDNDSRQFSLIVYLNEAWQEADGGALCLHHHFPDSLQTIAPTNRKGVFFKSNELEHEVQLTNQPRMSITGWLKL